MRCSRQPVTAAVSILQMDKTFCAWPLLRKTIYCDLLLKNSVWPLHRDSHKFQNLAQTTKSMNFMLRIQKDGVAYHGTKLSSKKHVLCRGLICCSCRLPSSLALEHLHGCRLVWSWGNGSLIYFKGFFLRCCWHVDLLSINRLMREPLDTCL